MRFKHKHFLTQFISYYLFLTLSITHRYFLALWISSTIHNPHHTIILITMHIKNVYFLSQYIDAEQTHLCFFSQCISQTDKFFFSLNLTKEYLTHNVSYHNEFHNIFLFIESYKMISHTQMFLITRHLKKYFLSWCASCM